MGEGEGGMIWENGIETCIIYMKRVSSPGSKHVYTICSLSVHPFDGLLGCFRILAIVNNAAVSTGMLMFFGISVLFSVDTYPDACI